MSSDLEFLPLKTFAEKVGIPYGTLHELLPDSVRELMERDGTGNRVRYHSKYLTAIEAMLAEVDEAGKRVVKPKTAYLFLAPRIEAINRGETLGGVPKPQTAKRKTQTAKRNSDSPSQDQNSSERSLAVADPAERALIALEKLATVGIVAALPDKLLTREEAMEEFGLASSTLQKISHARDGRAMKWKRSAVAAYVASWGD